jgi:hypothetical protein
MTDNYSTQGQQLMSTILLAFAAFLSIFGSFSILYSIIKKGGRWKSADRHGVVYSRIMAGMTIMDAFVAFSLFLSPYL